MFLHKRFLGGTELTELEDVLQNLRWILSTRRGAGYFLDNFGMSDVGFRTPEEFVVALTDELRENIRLYEPRVELVDVDEDWDDEGRRTKLLVRLRLRDTSDKLQVTIDLANKSFDVQPLKRARA